MTRKTYGGQKHPIEIDGIREGLIIPTSASFDVSELSIRYGDSPSVDAFARLRIAEPVTIFDSKQIFSNGLVGENQPLFWDNQEVSGGGTTTSYSQDEASTALGVSASTAGKRVRQTKMWFNYKPGKSLLVILTFNFNELVSGVTKRIGQFNDSNGLFLENRGTEVGVALRSNRSGSPVDTYVSQNDWNIDKMDGTGPSEITIDWTKAQILFFDYEWLGVGRVRFGFFIDGLPYYVHQFLNANNLPGVYISSPNLPIRYTIENDGTGAATTINTICATVISEGGMEKLGTFRTIPPSAWATNQIEADDLSVTYALMGIRLKDLAMTVDLVDLTAIAETNDSFIASVHMNPTLNFVPTWSDLTESGVQYSLGPTVDPGGAITNPGYTFFAQAVSNEVQSVVAELNNAVRLGSTIDGTPDEIWLGVTPLSPNLDIYGALTWRELL